VEALGAQVTVFPREAVGDIRLAKWNAASPGKPILLLTHMDTVWPLGTLTDAVPLRQEEGRLHGPGALDMKAGIAIAMEAIRGLQARQTFPQRPLWLLLTSDEETGSDHSRELIVEIAQQCALCLVMEPATENEGLKTWRKGIGSYTITAKGRAAHSGDAPEAGINAIIELAHQAIVLQGLNRLRQGTSVSITQIQGGIAGNVIPPQAACYVDMRFLVAAEGEQTDAAIRGLTPVLPGSDLHISGGIHRMPMERDAQMIETFQRAKSIAEKIGLPLAEGGTGGVSDGNLVAAAGIPTLDGMGGHGAGMHALHEHVLIRSLPRRAALLAALLQDWPLT
jgi:glutamate carboxypeptidase